MHIVKLNIEYKLYAVFVNGWIHIGTRPPANTIQITSHDRSTVKGIVYEPLTLQKFKQTTMNF